MTRKGESTGLKNAEEYLDFKETGKCRSGNRLFQSFVMVIHLAEVNYKMFGSSKDLMHNILGQLN